MTAFSASDLFRRVDAAEERVCISFNRLSHRKVLRVFFSAISRLGNGVFWYALMLLLPAMFGRQGALRAAQMVLTGAIGLLIYKWLKQRFVRERPYISHLSIRAGAAALDRYSFPSGHTLHATCFAILFCAYFPVLFWVVMPFAVLVAMSRVILGLHYPTDVAVGALLGSALALTSISLI